MLEPKVTMYFCFVFVMFNVIRTKVNNVATVVVLLFCVFGTYIAGLWWNLQWVTYQFAVFWWNLKCFIWFFSIYKLPLCIHEYIYNQVVNKLALFNVLFENRFGFRNAVQLNPSGRPLWFQLTPFCLNPTLLSACHKTEKIRRKIIWVSF